MADDNRPLKYMRYAIGEIVLVVIGILIALQINTWNEERKSLERERSLLTQMKYNLEYNLLEFSKVEKGYKNQRKSIKLVLNHISNKEKLHDSVSFHFYGPFRSDSPNLTSSAYETLKSNGLDILKSYELRENIINLYEVSYAEYTVSVEQVLNNWETEMIAPYYSKNFSVINDKFLTPNNYEFLFTDQNFINLLTFRRSYFAHVIDVLARMQLLTKNLIANLDSYLLDENKLF